MTLLPIAARELRVAARKRSTFWLRVSAALFGLVIGTACLIISSMAGAGSVGPALFGILTWFSVIGALLAGLFFTSDTLSEEKRDGTLGFLFLTDLRGYDVVAGKFLATSLRGIYALLAIFPILGVSLLLGGVTGSEFWKTNLALLNALICSLMAGLFVSALSRDSQKAMAATLLLLLGLVFGGPAIDAAWAGLRKGGFEPVLSLVSPGYVFVKAGGWVGVSFWKALLVSQAVCWLLFVLACWLAPRSWQERSRRSSGTSHWAYCWKYGWPKSRAKLRLRLMDRNPVLWLACRERWQSAGIWLLAVVAVVGTASLFLSEIPRNLWYVWPYVQMLFNWLLLIWAASQSCRFFVEAKKNGLFELLLSAPMRPERIISGQWRGLLRMFLIPVLLLLAARVVCWAIYQVGLGRVMTMASGSGNLMNLILAMGVALTSIVTTLSNLFGLMWFGMWMGLSSKGANWATAKTFVFVYLLPAMAISFISYLTGFALLMPWLMKFASSGSNAVMMWYPFITSLLFAVLTVAKDIGFFFLSRNRLHQSFREYVTGVKERPATMPLMPLTPPLARMSS